MKNIIFVDNTFALSTKNTTYLIRVTKFNHLEHVYYGSTVDIEDVEALSLKRNIVYGNTIAYDTSDDIYSLDILNQEIGTSGRGDFREPSLLIKHNNSTVLDLLYDSYEILEGDKSFNGLPDAYGADETLIITLKDEIGKIEVKLYYSIFFNEDVITRKMEIISHIDNAILNKVMSYSLDMNHKDLVLMSFDGAWINEFNKTERKIDNGTTVLESRCGFSSNTTNPGFIIRHEDTNEEYGEAWGFNLIYTGSHYSSISRNEKDNVRIMSGINPERFNYQLNKEESFFTPTAVLTYSDVGLNDLSHHFHNFINEHIVRGPYKGKDRPILINSWEGFMFDFNKTKLVNMAKSASKMGFEMFVLDDGWFKGRNNDKAGLGDYEVNMKKLPGGLKGLADEINGMGMKFGLWVEPEAVNPDSDLYKAHPEWAIENEYKTVYGRNELLLDLTNKDVRDYIVSNVTKILDEVNIEYVKWDMNRQLTGIDGEFNHRYILGLYEILERIFKGRDILFESCSSGGNRFDLGMLCYSPQIWTSDNTDAIERIRIQKNCSYLYPLSTISAHVNASVSSQCLRKVPLNTRFNVASFGVLGYELDLTMLSSLEVKEVKKQIEYYKAHRSTFVYGDFYRIKDDENKESFEVRNDEECIVGKFRKQMSSSPSYDSLKAYGLKPDVRYEIISREFSMNIEMFGHLINFVLPVKVNTEGLLVKEVSKYKGMDTKKEVYNASGKALRKGIIINNLFLGSGYNESVRLPLDYGSELYEIKGKENE